MKNVRFAIVVAALLLAGTARAASPNPGFANQEQQRAAAALVHSTPFYTDLTKDATPPSGFANQEERRAAAALVLTTRPYVDLSACPSSHEAAHDQIAQRALQVPDRDRGKLISSANCCTLANRIALAKVNPGDHR